MTDREIEAGPLTDGEIAEGLKLLLRERGRARKALAEANARPGQRVACNRSVPEWAAYSDSIAALNTFLLRLEASIV